MTKELYKILEINENATQDQIKKSYRKLAAKWHPDKWGSKSLQERQTANKKMQEINKAFEVLGDEERRKKYDGATDFVFDFSDLRDRINNQGKRTAELGEDIVDTGQGLDRLSAISVIDIAFFTTQPRVFEENLSKSLWEPYQDWKEKVEKMGINELEVFKKEMIKAIKEAEVVLETKKKEKQIKKKESSSSEVEQKKMSAIEGIERLMTEKGLKAKNLGKYSNYKREINNLNEVWEVDSLEEEIKDFIVIESINYGVGHLESKNYYESIPSNYYNEQYVRTDERMFNNQFSNEAWNKEEKVPYTRLVAENKQLLEEVRQLKGQVQYLLEENNQLKQNQANIQFYK